MHAKKMLSLLMMALLVVMVLASCGGKTNFSKEVTNAFNSVQSTVDFDTDSRLTKALENALKENVQTTAVRDAMLADKNLQSLLTSGYQLDVFAVSANDAKEAAKMIAQNAAGVVGGKKGEGKIAMVLADNGYYYAAVLTYRDNSGGDEKPEPSPTLESCSITSQPSKIIYLAGQNFAPDGIQVIGTYSDGTEADVTNQCTYQPDNITADTDSITVRCGNWSDEISITVISGVSLEGTTLKVGADAKIPGVSGTSLTKFKDMVAAYATAADVPESSITSIDTTGSGITTIADDAFYTNKNLVSVNMPGVKEVGSWAFGLCKKLTSVNLPDVKKVGANGFNSCVSLAYISLPSATTIGEKAFQSCYDSYGEGAYGEGSGLISVSLPAVEEIGDQAFHSNSALRHILLGSNLNLSTGIGKQAFFAVNYATFYYDGDEEELKTAIKNSGASDYEVAPTSKYPGPKTSTNSTAQLLMDVAQVFN